MIRSYRRIEIYIPPHKKACITLFFQRWTRKCVGASVVYQNSQAYSITSSEQSTPHRVQCDAGEVVYQPHNSIPLQPPTFKRHTWYFHTTPSQKKDTCELKDPRMTLKFPSEISQENSMTKLTKPNTEKEELLFFASRIVQICSDLDYQLESTSFTDNEFQSSGVADSQNSLKIEESDPSWRHYIEVEGPSARTQVPKATPENVNDAADDDDIQMKIESNEPILSDDSDVVEFSGPGNPLNNNSENADGVADREDENRQKNLRQMTSNLRENSMYSGSESERKEMEPRATTPLSLGMDRSTTPPHLQSIADNSEERSREIASQTHSVSKAPKIAEAEVSRQQVLRPRNRTKPASSNMPLAESDEETHDQNDTIGSSETSLSPLSGPAKNRVRIHNSRYTCTYCGKQEFYNSNLVQHLRTHTGEKPFPCTLCEKRFSQSTQLRLHLQTHTGEKPFPCTLCEKRFRRSHDLSIHVRTHTGEKPFPCTFCDKRFSQSCDLSVHLRSHTGEKPFPCTLCEKRYSQSSSLRLHIRTHTGEKPFPCTFCDKRFPQTSQLRLHIRTHTGEKPYSCTLCEKRFSQSSSLRLHIRTHTGERPYSCTLCHQSFSSKAKLDSHTRVHTGEKPFECTVCSKSFSQKGTLVNHTRTHTGERSHNGLFVQKNSQ